MWRFAAEVTPQPGVQHLLILFKVYFLRLTDSQIFPSLATVLLQNGVTKGRLSLKKTKGKIDGASSLTVQKLLVLN